MLGLKLNHVTKSGHRYFYYYLNIRLLDTYQFHFAVLILQMECESGGWSEQCFSRLWWLTWCLGPSSRTVWNGIHWGIAVFSTLFLYLQLYNRCDILQYIEIIYWDLYNFIWRSIVLTTINLTHITIIITSNSTDYATSDKLWLMPI